MVPPVSFFRKILPVLLLFSSMQAFAQKTHIDSLKQNLTEYEIKKKNLGKRATAAMDTVAIDILHSIGYEYYLKQSPNEGIQYGMRGLHIAEKLGDKRKIARMGNLMGILYTYIGDFSKGIFYQKMALDAVKYTKNRQLEAYLYINIGVNLTQIANYPEALEYLYRGLELSKKNKDGQAIAACYNNIGIIYGNQGQFEEALKIYFSALDYQQKHNDLTQLCYTQQNIGEIYTELRQFGKAELWYSKGLESAVKAKNKEAQANNYDGLCKVETQLKKYNQALKYCKAALALRRETEDPTGLAGSLINMGNILLKQKKYRQAQDTITAGVRLSRETGLAEGIKEGSEYLSLAYEATGQFAEAYRNHVEFKRISDSIFNAEKDKKLTELRLTNQFNTKQKEQKALQQKKDTANELKSKQQRSAIYAVLIALVIVTFFAFWINYNLQRNKKQKKTIEVQNEKIQHSLEEKETLLREIHHRVKNNLQIISSLLNIQSENIKDETLLSSIQEGQSRVQAMSLIHQNLYQSEQVNNVDIENYLRELVVYLSQMFRADKKDIKTEINTDGIQFDIDTAIPLGLIVNELVSNAYKYAFENRENGVIKISIHAVGSEYELHIDNNGKPLPDDFDIKNTKSLGLKLVSILSRQLRGKFSFHSDENNTSFIVFFKDLKTLN